MVDLSRKSTQHTFLCRHTNTNEAQKHATPQAPLSTLKRSDCLKRLLPDIKPSLRVPSSKGNVSTSPRLPTPLRDSHIVFASTICPHHYRELIFVQRAPETETTTARDTIRQDVNTSRGSRDSQLYNIITGYTNPPNICYSKLLARSRKAYCRDVLFGPVSSS
jgi:hypothetical protein